VLGILVYPVAAVLGETLFEVVAGALGDPERRPVAGMDLQPDPGNGEAAVGPKVVADTAREAMPRPRCSGRIQ
jgi:hypothetical protein